MWVKLRNSTRQATRVVIVQAAMIDQLKKAIKTKTGDIVDVIYLEEGQGENGTCLPDDLVLSHGEVGNFANRPYYYTILSGKN